MGADDVTVWTWIVGGLVVWALVAAVLGVVIGRSIRLADVRSPGTPVDRPLPAAASDGVVTRRAGARRRIPLSPVGVGLAATAVALETAGFVLRLTDADGPLSRVLSMDAPSSLPRLYVAGLFAAAALAAVAAAGRTPARRGWWLAVGLVAAGIAVVKAGGTVHEDAVHALTERLGAAGAVTVGVALLAVVLLVLAVLTRAERRDRRRVLGALAAYGVASVGLSAVSAVAGSWAVTATYLEESGEALAGVAFLVAVLVGVAPRLVLPADVVLRRRADAETLDATAVRLPGQRGATGR
ncbi:hypothetical protein SAMN05660690_1241 [Geodermatophilus telluris]|uniref:Uncharacterized protein n=1 Tax=Geodermatophilus telluris TaxID=1190417 RepID=A0A1G6L7Y1_9ACTN|nr:hypothetical protein [Geodermatophilus telluris]SDC39243.1 hypothetical protein SAMN05660690_1241 [Geodermatophilus telluris]